MLVKVLNKMIYWLKNILLPLVLASTVFIVILMYQRLDKHAFGTNFLEFISIAIPFVLLMVLYLLNSFLHQENVKNNLFYNITSLLVMITISMFCYRALFDKNLIFWHKYKYDINFNYFSDQISPIKIMLYGLSIGDILLMIANNLKNKDIDNQNELVLKNKNIL